MTTKFSYLSVFTPFSFAWSSNDQDILLALSGENPHNAVYLALRNGYFFHHVSLVSTHKLLSHL